MSSRKKKTLFLLPKREKTRYAWAYFKTIICAVRVEISESSLIWTWSNLKWKFRVWIHASTDHFANLKKRFDQGKWQERVWWPNQASEDKELSALMSMKREVCGPDAFLERLQMARLEGVGLFHAGHLQMLKCCFFWNTCPLDFHSIPHSCSPARWSTNLPHLLCSRKRPLAPSTPPRPR